MTFDGETYDATRDEDRLGSQLGAVFALMRDGAWRTLPEIIALCGGNEASISARLRDLRKARFGAHIVQREYVSDGLHKYRMLKNSVTEQRSLYGRESMGDPA